MPPQTTDVLPILNDRQVLTPGQLHLLRQQIDALRRINVHLRALKYRARTGQELSAQQAARATGGGRSRGGRGRPTTMQVDSGNAKHIVIAGRWGRGRSRGTKRGRADESEDDDSIVVQSSEEDEEEAAVGSSSEGEEDASPDDDESADSSESEDDFTLPAVTVARRTGRVRRLSSAAAAVVGFVASERGDGNHSNEREPLGRGNSRHQLAAAAVPEPVEEEHGGGPSSAQTMGRARKQARSANPDACCSGQEGGGTKRHGLFMLVAEDVAASDAAIQLPQLKAVHPAWQGGDSGEGEGSEEDAVCSVCFDGDAVAGNVILLCEGKGCSVAVHQMCYGVSTVPKGRWLCEACKAKLNPWGANCCVCPMVGSAVKKVASLGRLVPAGKPKAVHCHLACALWVPEIELANHEQMAGVRLDKLTAARTRLRCELCKQAGGGSVQCAMGTCCRSFHVLCGHVAGQTLTFRSTDGEPLAFCELHSRPAFEKLVRRCGRKP